MYKGYIWKKVDMRPVLLQATSIKTKFQPYTDMNWILVSLNPDNYKFPLPNLWKGITEEYNDPLYSKSWNKREVLAWFPKEMAYQWQCFVSMCFPVWVSVSFGQNQYLTEGW